MRSILFDIEANGLLDSVTKIWCSAAIDLQTKEWFTFTPDTVHKLPELLQKYDICIGHNIVGYDFPLLKKMYGFTYNGIMFDTLIASRVLFSDIGKHDLDSWGKRVGIIKPPIEDWSYYDEDKLNRCIEDVKINLKVYERILEFINKYSIRNSRITYESMLQWLFFERKMTENLDQQAENGWYFDINECYRLIEWLEPQIKETENIIIPKLPHVMENKYKTLPVMKPFKMDGAFTTNAINYIPDEQLDNVVGEFCRVQFRPMRLNDHSYMKKYLLKLGWVPTEWNYKPDPFGKPLRDPVTKERIRTSPVLPDADEWDIVAEQANNPDLKLIAQYNKMCHRRNVLTGWTKAIRGDQRIPAQCISSSQVTQRCSPKIIVNVPRADGNTYLGQEMRGLFQAAPGRVLVGCDADSLEARITASFIYPYDKVLAMELIEGDLHSKNVEKFKNYNVPDRQTAKNTFYELLYGAQPPSIALSHSLSESAAKYFYNSFWKEYPAIAQLRDDVIAEFKENGFLIGIDGRPLTVRYQHAALNTRIQSTGALTMKLAYCIFAKKIKTFNLDCMIIGFFHDEICTECHPDIADTVGTMIAESMTEAGKQFRLNVPITGSYKIGASWKEIH